MMNAMQLAWRNSREVPLKSAAIILDRTIPTWLEEHLETFVRKELGHVPNINPGHYNLFHFTQNNVNNLKLLWEQAKKAAGDMPMLLAGRDVYLFEILARCEGYPTTYRQDISRSTVKHIADRNDYSQYFLIDTGYRGTIPNALSMNHWKLISYNVSCTTGKTTTTEEKLKHQLAYPRTEYVYLAGTMECAPKYYKQAFLSSDPNGQQFVTQEREQEEMFTAASWVTRIMATGKSPLGAR
jgi:hypothetical protein